MREIKFRGICIADGELKGQFVYGDLLQKNGRTYISPFANAVEVTAGHLGKLIIMHEVDSATVGQYTELKDVNGKEIYEGDILEITHEDGDSEVYHVKYFADNDYPAFDLVPHLDCDSNGLSHAMAVCTVKKVGNIYENPELLKEKTE